MPRSGRTRFCVALAFAGLGLVAGSLAIGGTYADLSDFDVAHEQVAAGAWAPDITPLLPAECAGIAFGFGVGQPPVSAATNGDDFIVGTSGDDVFDGGNGNDLIFGLGGNDVILGGNGNDCLVGGDANDFLGGDRGSENGEDVLLGGPGDDGLDGGNAKDVLYGGAGNDSLDGTNGKDLAYGDAGSDQLRGANGTDLLHGGSGPLVPDTDVDTCTGGRAPDVYQACEVVDGVSAVTP